MSEGSGCTHARTNCELWFMNAGQLLITTNPQSVVNSSFEKHEYLDVFLANDFLHLVFQIEMRKIDNLAITIADQ